MQVLSRVLAYCVDPRGKIPSNPCEGIQQIYSGSRSEIIWTDADIEHLKKTCSIEIALRGRPRRAYRSAARRPDAPLLVACRRGRNHHRTGKKYRRQAIIPLYDALRDVLARIPRRSPVILTNSKLRPWSGFGASFTKAKATAWPKGDQPALPRLARHGGDEVLPRGLSEREIGKIMGWEEESVRKIIRRYVDRQAAIKERIRKLNEARK